MAQTGPGDARLHDPLRRARCRRQRQRGLPRRHADGHRWPQRRRQDHLLQPDLGPASSLAPARCCSTARPSPARRRRAGETRHRPRLPAHQPVSQPHRARERAACRSGPRRRRAATSSPAGTSRRDWIEARRQIYRRAPTSPTSATPPAVALPHGDKRKLEVAIMMALEPHVFMFDEPTAGMSVDDVPVILDLIKRAEERGQQDHPAGRAQDGRGEEPRRPHRRASQRPAGCRRRAGRGDRLGQWCRRPISASRRCRTSARHG